MRAQKIYVYKGKSFTVKDLAEMSGMNEPRIRSFITRYTLEDFITGKAKPKKYERANNKNMGRCTAKSYKDCLNCPYEECTRVTKISDEPRANDYVSMTGGIQGAENYDIIRISS